MVGIKYIGERDQHKDNLYGTELEWIPGQTHNVADDIAEKMLRHADVYAEAKTVKGEKAAQAVTEVQPEKNYIPLPHLEGMNQEELANFVQQYYGEKLDGNMSVEDMRLSVHSIIQSKGR